jgi:hypothetical protein
MKCPHCPTTTLVMTDRQGIEIERLKYSKDPKKKKCPDFWAIFLSSSNCND